MARIQLSLAHIEAELGTAEQGFTLCNQILGAADVSDEVRGLAMAQLGLLQMRAGDGGAALRSFSKALPHIGELTSDVARVYLHRGNVHLQRGMTSQASTDFLEAVRYFELAGLPTARGKAQHNLGYARMLSGDLIGALSLMDEARALADESPAYEAVCEQDRAEVLMAAGMVVDAEEALRHAAACFGARRLRQRQAEAELSLAQLLLRRDVNEAGRVARRARRRFEVRGSHSWALRAEVVSLASATLSGHRWSVTKSQTDDLERGLSSQGFVHDAQTVTLLGARAALRVGDSADASNRLRRVRVTGSTPLPIRLLRQEVSSALCAARGRRRQALNHVQRGLSDLHEWQSSFGSLDLQSSVVGHGRALALQGLSLAVADGRPDVVFEWSERARALAGRVAPVRPPMDEDAARDLTELRRVQADITTADATGKVPLALRKNADELRVRIRQRAWYDKGSGLITEPETLDSVQRRLAPEEVVVSILTVDEQLHALVVTSDLADVVALGPLAPVRSLLDGMQADLDMAATHLPSPIRQAVHAGLGQRLIRLSSLLVGPWSRRVRDRRVIVVPSGVLAGTPWTLLPDLAGLPVTVPRSATEWVTSHDDTRQLVSAGFVAGPRVDRAYEEVKRSAHAWVSADVLGGGDVRAERVRDLASQVDVFHVAAHGRHSADNPLFSGLELVDGPWFGYDIDQVRSIPSTVILSACELGRSTVRWGEETIGMTAAWLHAGARCVIASPASVDDDLACEVLAATHRRLAAGVPPAEALAEAMASVEGGVAPFICFGSGW